MEVVSTFVFQVKNPLRIGLFYDPLPFMAFSLWLLDGGVILTPQAFFSFPTQPQPLQGVPSRRNFPDRLKGKQTSWIPRCQKRGENR